MRSFALTTTGSVSDGNQIMSWEKRESVGHPHCFWHIRTDWLWLMATVYNRTSTTAIWLFPSSQSAFTVLAEHCTPPEIVYSVPAVLRLFRQAKSKKTTYVGMLVFIVNGLQQVTLQQKLKVLTMCCWVHSCFSLYSSELGTATR